MSLFLIQKVILQLIYDVTKVKKDKKERGVIIFSSKFSLLLKLKLEGELDTQKLKYSMDLDCSSENDDNSGGSSRFQEDFLDTQELSYSVDLSDLSENDQSESDESIPDLCLLKPYDFEPLVKKIQNNTDLQTKEVTAKRIGNTNWCQCGLRQPMEHHFCRTPPDD